jgi:hypothetical protein
VRADEQKPDRRRCRRTSGLLIAKSISIKDGKRRFGGCARKAAGLLEILSVSWRLGKPRGSLTAGQKSAEGILGHAVDKADEASETEGGATMSQSETVIEGEQKRR